MAAATMRAAQFSQFGGPDVLEIVDLPIPEVGPGEIRVAVHAVGIGGTDWKSREGRMGGPLPQTTGREFAGIVDAVADDVSAVGVGDRVFGVTDGEIGTAAAEYLVATHFARIPDSLDLVHAAAMPVSAETATRGLNSLGVADGTLLLVNGASGGVGSAAVQLAVARGARVIGVAGPTNQPYVAGLGAEPVVYGDGMAERVRALAPDGVDRALDVAGNGILPLLIELARGETSHVVTLADFPGAKQTGVHFSTGEDGRALHVLTDLGPLVEAGKFSVPVAATFPLDRIADAHRAGEAGVQGRVVVLID